MNMHKPVRLLAACVVVPGRPYYYRPAVVVY